VRLVQWERGLQDGGDGGTAAVQGAGGLVGGAADGGQTQGGAPRDVGQTTRLVVVSDR
jgi:hypothetical protein